MIRDILTYLKSFFKSMGNRRTIITLLICFVIAIAPACFAIIYSNLSDDSFFFSSSKVSVELYDAKGNLIEEDEMIETNVASSTLISIFYNLSDKITLPQDQPTTPPAASLSFKISIGDKSSTYRCHFNESHESSYLQDNNGIYYIVEKESYSAFLNSSYSEVAYNAATPPSLLSGDGDLIIPSEVNWNYKRLDGSFAKSQNISTISYIPTYRVGGAIDFDFSRTPSQSTAKVYNSASELIHTCSAEELGFIAVDVGESLTVRILASWDNDADADCYGSISYNFNVTIIDRAEFFVDSDSVLPGEFITLVAKNVDDFSRITYTSEFNYADDSTIDYSNSIFNFTDDEQEAAIERLYGYIPTFFACRDYAVALIPFPQHIPEGDFKFSVSYGATAKSFSITVLPSLTIDNVSIPKEHIVLSPAVSVGAVSDFFALVDLPFTPTRTLIPPKFSDPVYSGDFKAGYSFGAPLFSSDGEPLIDAPGNEYLRIGTQSVRALNVGVVVSTGYLSTLGNYIIIDHGLGIRIWYCWLFDSQVAVGDIVDRDEIIGRCKNGTLLSESGTLIVCTVNNTLVDPASFIGRDILGDALTKTAN